MEFVVKTKKPHFLGSIILKEGRKPRQGENFADCRTIVDGQQRLTTFLILSFNQPSPHPSVRKIGQFTV